MPKLSVIMIVKNEEDCLGQCLQSVRAIEDEIVVGDTGSTEGHTACQIDKRCGLCKAIRSRTKRQYEICTCPAGT